MKKMAILVCVSSLLGCSASPLNDGAESVRVMDTAPQHCQYLGEVNGSQGNMFTADLTSDKNILIGARNQLRNQAHALGANVVVIQKSVDNSNEGLYAYGDKDSLRMSSSKGTYSSTLIGEAFYCEAKAP
ncbi:DUF4156 domain-containing protein [Vibrio parahaemolyticus]|jgi:hypothetical protein|uniref:DUF4156 domain-containing protein n=1 Tax=Vibrio mediterranei TaxID=689 RepID=UPI004068B942